MNHGRTTDLEGAVAFVAGLYNGGNVFRDQIGRAHQLSGVGLNDAELGTLSALMNDKSRQKSPFEDVPVDIMCAAQWIRPAMVIETEYAEFTNQGILRHRVFKGLRENKEAGMAKLEKPSEKPDDTGTVLGVRISNADRVVFDDAGYTKGDVARYYEKASNRMLRLAGRRPVALLRCPDGRDGVCFFQKHAGKGFPDGIDTMDLEESSGKTEPYMLINRRAGFVAAAQMGTVEFHIWGSRKDMLEKPDRLVFDLDPDEGLSFSDVKEAAEAICALLDRVGLGSVPMVTGGKGVHVIVPLRRTAGWETVSVFSRTVASYLASREPGRYVATMSKAKRKNRIFIDWLRNDRGSTAIAPYSIRARKGAPVAVPVSWKELAGLEAANAFDMGEALKRLDKPCPLDSMQARQSISLDVVEKLEHLIGS